jgi:hypothetical protein
MNPQKRPRKRAAADFKINSIAFPAPGPVCVAFDGLELVAKVSLHNTNVTKIKNG